MGWMAVNREVQTAKRRWWRRSRGPEPGPRLRCAGSDTWGTQTRWSCFEFVNLGDWVFFGVWKIFLLVLGSCSEVPLSGPPSPIEGHNRDHLEVTHQLAKDLDIEVFEKCSTAEQIDTDCRPLWRWCRSRPRAWRRRSPTHQSGRQCSRYKRLKNIFYALSANLLCE